MPRQYDKYGFNRQFRRNPSRKRNPFPYRLPFMPDFRLNPFDDPDYDVSAATASRYRQAIDELVNKHGEELDSRERAMKRKRNQVGRNRDHNRKFRKVAASAQAAQTLANGIMLTAIYTGDLATII